MVDWSRIASPQSDGYDCAAALWLRGDLPFIESPHRIFDTVAITPAPRAMGPNIADAPLDHPNIKKAEGLVNLWPVGARSLKTLMRQFHPLNVYPEPQGRGSTCGSDEQAPGTMYATVYSAEGLAEAFMHEFGHNKLRFLGIHLECADRLIANSPDELFESPLRKDKLRPMSAVTHAVFSYCYVTALNIEMAKRGDTLDSLRLNRNRIAEGREVMKANLKTNADGDKFFSGFFSWLDEVICTCDLFLTNVSKSHGV